MLSIDIFKHMILTIVDIIDLDEFFFEHIHSHPIDSFN